MEKRRFYKYENIGSGYLYFLIHLFTEVCCFYALTKVTGNSFIIWFTPLLYDFSAFVLQEPMGVICDKYRRFNPGIWGSVLMAIGLFTLLENQEVYSLFNQIFNMADQREFMRFNSCFSIFLIAVGNGFVHIDGAERTLRTSGGKLSHSAIFVAGGSFGVVLGKILGGIQVPTICMISLSLTIIPLVIFAKRYKEISKASDFAWANKKISPKTVIVLAILIVTVRGYMGYGIPTGWNKSLWQNVLLYVMMGTGKAVGGILCDRIGIKKTALISIAGAAPFLLAGDRLMIISLIGVMMFSMTMAVTLGLLVSVSDGHYGAAFGFTTIGLFLGTVPMFIVRIEEFYINCIIILVATILCFFPAMYICSDEKPKWQQDNRSCEIKGEA